MSDVNDTPVTPDPAADSLPEPEEWKPEPRKWEWRDLLTAPLLAFRPKCMLIAAVTMTLIGLFGWGWSRIVARTITMPVLNVVVLGSGLIIASVIFSLGTTLIATFMKADLLDDEFLTLGEAFGKWSKRLKAAVLVPTFLILILMGLYTVLYLGLLFCSIPYVGPMFYSVFYVFAYLFALLTIFLLICIALSYFIFPAIVAIRQHGWFDNVIDTIEAVVTKPSVLILNLFIIGLMCQIIFGICAGASMLLTGLATYDPSLPGYAVAKTEYHATEMKLRTFQCCPVAATQHALVGKGLQSEVDQDIRAELAQDQVPTHTSVESLTKGYSKGTGYIAGFWHVVIAILVAGYLVNIHVAGGMLTYLAVREEDYWDDEDMEDLDQLAKELEEEAKAEAAKLEAEAVAKDTDAPVVKAEEPKAEEPKVEEPKAEKPKAEGDEEAKGV